MVLTVEEVKTHLRIQQDEEDIYLGTLIAQAQAAAEDFCRVSFTESIPEPVRLAVLLMVSHYYEHREIQDNQIIGWCTQSPMKTISIHSVRSDRAVLDVLEKTDCTKRNNCILHWYSGTLKQLDRAIELGCFFSINEYMLNSSTGRPIIEEIPIDRLLLESDAPFISNIKTVEQLKRSIEFCLHGLIAIKGKEVPKIIYETSRQLFGKA